MIAGGALAFAFIPIFAGFLAQGDDQKAWRTASHVINTLFLVTLAVSVIAFLVAPWLVANVVAPGFPPEQQAETVGLMRILLVSTLIFSVSGIVMGILQSHNNFLLPALAPILFDVGVLFGALIMAALSQTPSEELIELLKRGWKDSDTQVQLTALVVLDHLSPPLQPRRSELIKSAKTILSKNTNPEIALALTLLK